MSIIAVDFDGTLCMNQWPDIGEANQKLINYLKSRQEQGDKLILWTCRSGVLLNLAVQWCFNVGLVFDEINKNVPEMIAKFGEDSRKVYADEYIDDRSCCKFKLPFCEAD